MRRPECPALKAGDKVLVVRSATDMRRRPESERYIPAVVVKAARIWLTIKPADQPDGWQAWRMRRDTQAEQTDYPGSQSRLVTPEQAEYDQRMRAVDAVIRDAKVRLDDGPTWSGAERTWTDARRAALADLIISLGILTEKQESEQA